MKKPTDCPNVMLILDFDDWHCRLLRQILSLLGWMKEGSKRFLKHMHANMLCLN